MIDQALAGRERLLSRDRDTRKKYEENERENRGEGMLPVECLVSHLVTRKNIHMRARFVPLLLFLLGVHTVEGGRLEISDTALVSPPNNPCSFGQQTWGSTISQGCATLQMAAKGILTRVQQMFKISLHFGGSISQLLYQDHKCGCSLYTQGSNSGDNASSCTQPHMRAGRMKGETCREIGTPEGGI